MRLGATEVADEEEKGETLANGDEITVESVLGPKPVTSSVTGKETATLDRPTVNENPEGVTVNEQPSHAPTWQEPRSLLPHQSKDL